MTARERVGRWGGIVAGALTVAVTAPAGRADTLLPYSDRTRAYSAFDATVRGDLRTIGMAGAMAGLADSYTGSVDNPAGLALTVDSTGIQFSGNTVQDGEVQSYPSLIKSRSQVVMGNWCPWGLSFAIWSPQSAGESYLLPGRPPDAPMGLSIETREYRLSAARLFKEHLAVGLTFLVGRNTQTIGTQEHSAFAYSAAAGVQYLLPYRLIAGVSYTPPLSYATDPNETPTTGVTHFFQPAHSPYRLGLGLGWIPNRFFRASGAFYAIGSTPQTSLLRDDAIVVGNSMSIQPRAGLSYQAIDFKELKAELELGSYLEFPRIGAVAPRWHGTFGIELKLWVFNLGWGLDEARLYQNFIYTFGVDVGKILRKLDLIPQERKVASGGFLPNPFRVSDEGLSHSLVPGSVEVFGKSAIDVGLEAPEKLRNLFMNGPENLQKGIMQMGTDFKGTFYDTVEALPFKKDREAGVKKPRAAAPRAPSPRKPTIKKPPAAPKRAPGAAPSRRPKRVPSARSSRD